MRWLDKRSKPWQAACTTPPVPTIHPIITLEAWEVITMDTDSTAHSLPHKTFWRGVCRWNECAELDFSPLPHIFFFLSLLHILPNPFAGVFAIFTSYRVTIYCFSNPTKLKRKMGKERGRGAKGLRTIHFLYAKGLWLFLWFLQRWICETWILKNRLLQ